MKLLLINSVCGRGSTGRICQELSEMVREHGGKAVTAYGRAGNTWKSVLPYSKRIGADSDVAVHGLLTRIFDAQGLGSRKATEDFVSWMRRFDPDIIHLHNIHGYYLHVGVLFEALREMNKPIVWTLHDCWTFTGHCANYSRVGCGKWKGGCIHCVQKTTYPRSVLLDRSARNYEMKKRLFTMPENMTIVTPSDWLAGEVRESFLKKYPVRTIHNGIDTGVFRPVQSGLREKYGLVGKKIALGAAAVWNESKGMNELLRLAESLGKEWTVVLVGLTGWQLRQLPKNVVGIVKTDSPMELARWYSAADVFVNPTLEDTFPTTNLEAQCCGTPVVTFQTGGSPEGIYPPLRHRLVCPDRDMETLTEYVHSAGTMTSEQRQAIAAWGVQEFHKRIYLDKYNALYRLLL